jgi:hypothetical protein
MLLLMAAPAATAAPLCAQPGVDGSAEPDGVINHYFPGPDGRVLAQGARAIPLDPPRPSGGLAAGDRVLLIQMQGARIRSDNDPDYGDGRRDTPAAGWTDLRSGQFEWLRVEKVGDAGIRVRGGGKDGGLIHRYENREPGAAGGPGRARWQLVRVPQYQEASLSGDVRALPWNGRTGGVLALDVRATLDLAGHSLEAQGLGFRGGGALTLQGALGDARDFRYRAPTSADLASGYGHHAAKGEGVAGTPRYVRAEGGIEDTRAEADARGRSDGYPGGSMARGAPGNAGGGGNSLSLNNELASGGGGGAGGEDGEPGRDAEGQARGGRGGAGVAPDRLRLIPGGGGGAGTRSRDSAPAGGGGAGGGIIVVSAGRVQGQGTLSVAGAPGRDAAKDAGGGGGGAGTLMLQAPFGDTSGVQLDLGGGAGGDAPAPGGTGGAGRLIVGGGLAWQPPSQARVWPDFRVGYVPGAAPAWRCRPQGTLISGTVFEDNGRGGQPLDGFRQGDEGGVPGWRVVVEDTEGRTHAQTRTNRAGHFALKLPPELEGTELHLRVALPGDWHAVAASEQDLPVAPMRHMEQGHWRFTAHSDVQYDGLRLAVVREPDLRKPEQRSISPGSTQLFAFRYRPRTPGRVRFHYRGNLRAETQWEHTFLLDPDCDGNSEYVDRETTRWIDNQPGRSTCIRVRVKVPPDARDGALDIRVTAETEIGTNPLETTLPQSDSGMRVKLQR